MGAMTVVKRSEALAKERFKHDGQIERQRRTSEIEFSLEGLQSMPGAHTAGDVLTNTIDTVSENHVGRKFT